jgi:hypothetical protein
MRRHGAPGKFRGCPSIVIRRCPIVRRNPAMQADEFMATDASMI